MRPVAYLFERFPSFGQTFCYREVAELVRQGAELSLFSIRRPVGEPPQDWDEAIVSRVVYLPEEKALVAEIDRAAKAGELPEAAVRGLKAWGRQSDFLRLYQAVFVGLRLREAGSRRVHAHFAGMAARTAYWVREFFGIDYSFTAHANDIFAPRDFVVSLAKLFESATAVVTVSDFSAEQLRRQFPGAAGKIHRVYNGIQLERFRPATLAAEVPVIVSVGRLIEKKGFADLVSACALLKERGCHFRCEIVGEGPLHDALAAQIEHVALGDCMQLVGPRGEREIVESLARAAVFVLPCVVEADGGMDNLPTVIMEAMAAGLPVISTPVAGVPEMVQPGVTGELVPPHDPPALAEAMQTMISGVALARRLGDAGRRAAAEKFAIEVNVRSLTAILNDS
ncbi:MAG: glycosyltransferase [Chthoniobacterales bacterium]|nr:glycosyltransferase [Chthoniobacterales bacterium]